MSFKKIITRDDGKPYLIRYRIFECNWFKIRVHHILLSDYDCLHDHPWNFVSVILRGGYFEHWSLRQKVGNYINPYLIDNQKTWHGSGSILYRKAEYKHSLEIPAGKTCWTLVVMFKRKRDWGFWTKDGWVFWKKYDPKSKCE